MNCSSFTLYRNPCKNKDIGENGLCKKHSIIEMNAMPIIEGKCVYIRRNNERCLKNAYNDGENKNYCAEHSLYVLHNKTSSCKCCIQLYMNIQQNLLDGKDNENEK